MSFPESASDFLLLFFVGRQRKSVCEREISYLLVHVLKCPQQPELILAASNSIRVSCVSGRDPTTWQEASIKSRTKA